MIVCLIDGDGNIFSPELIKRGQVGGRQAAMQLTKGLTDHLTSIDPTDATIPTRGQLWLTIYCNKNGLVDTLTSNAVCTAEQFEAFVLGFNQASPLFSIVDVGNGKEAADSKIKGTSCLFPPLLCRVTLSLWCRMPPRLHALPANDQGLLRGRARQRLHLYTHLTAERGSFGQGHTAEGLQRPRA